MKTLGKTREIAIVLFHSAGDLLLFNFMGQMMKSKINLIIAESERIAENTKFYHISGWMWFDRRLPF